ncbi:MAG: hypothetical protein KAI66_18630, partial [Lentisphaeria bacterium]|nr:hypothetical protein [Lentisphaeria bacterium]
LHDTYGTKVNCNIYFQCEDFDLTKFPDAYKSEWQDNADWFRMTFHALQNEPSKLYIAADYDEVAHDFDLVTNEILRFAGEEAVNAFTTIHWGEATREGCRAVRERGVRGLCGYFRLGADGEPAVSYYAGRATTEHLSGRDAWMDWAEDILFVKHDLVINSGAMDRIVPTLDEAASDPHRRDMMEVMIHEQYFYPDYCAYLPDYGQRCETTARWMHEHGYQPVFWSDGFLGV